METFVIRLWIPAKDEATAVGPPALRGIVERPASAESRRFQSGEELLELLHAGVTSAQVSRESS